MSARPFIDGPYCRDCRKGNTRHRERCRDTGAPGETFRAGLARVLALPVVTEGEPHNFACPFGYAWDWKAGATPAPRPVAAPKPTGIPLDQWPRRAKLIARLKRDGEKGVGDTLKRLIGDVGGDRFAKLYTLITGKDCGCGDRAARLNRDYPYRQEMSSGGS